jgi:hypothetical protein
MPLWMRFRVGVIESAATAVRGRGSLVRHLRMLAEVRRIEEMVVINESQRQSLAWVTVVFEAELASPSSTVHGAFLT